MKRNTVVMRLVAAALFSAMIMILTLLNVRVPGTTTGAYIHAGDSLIYTCSWFIGGFYSASAAALGSFLADLYLGAADYMFATLVIKFIMGLVCALMLRMLGDRPWAVIVSAGAGAFIMISGYGAYEWFMFGKAAAFGNMPANLIQGVAGIVIVLPIITALKNVKALDVYRKMNKDR